MRSFGAPGYQLGTCLPPSLPPPRSIPATILFLSGGVHLPAISDLLFSCEPTAPPPPPPPDTEASVERVAVRSAERTPPPSPHSVVCRKPVFRAPCRTVPLRAAPRQGQLSVSLFSFRSRAPQLLLLFIIPPVLLCAYIYPLLGRPNRY